MTTIAATNRKAGQLVNTQHTDSLISNYKKERWVHNSQRIGKEDSLSIWYSLEELQAFLDKAKASGADGIRMFFGVYDKQTAKEEVYEDRQTIVLVATQARDTAEGVVDKNIYISTETGSSILAFNVGRPCPPLCRPGILGDDGGDIGITIIDKGNDGIVVI